VGAGADIAALFSRWAQGVLHGYALKPVAAVNPGKKLPRGFNRGQNFAGAWLSARISGSIRRGGALLRVTFSVARGETTVEAAPANDLFSGLAAALAVCHG